MKKRFKYKFTLAEILVSMVVFSILLVLIMQFFSGARTLWTANEKRAAIYSDAAAAMDLMATLLHSTFCFDDKADPPTDQTPFEIASSASSLRGGSSTVTGNDGMIVFLSNSLMDLSSGSSIRYLSFSRDTPDPAPADVTNNVLYLKVYSDQEKDFSDCFYEWAGSVSDKDSALGVIKSAMKGFSRKSDSKKCKPVLRNVTGLKFVPLKIDGTELTAAADLKKTPAAIRIELSIMENEDAVRKYQSLSGTAQTEFKEQNEYTFRRTVWLGKRDAAL